MSFLKAQAKGVSVGFLVLIAWAALDWFSAQVGLPFSAHRDYSATFFAATAGAGVVFTWRDARD